MHHRHQIIIADESADNGAILAKCLRQEGFGVDVATDNERLMALLGCRPSLAVIASEFSTVAPSAAEHLRRIRCIPRLRRLPVVIIAERDDPADRLAAFKGGADAYLVKPVSTRELALRVRAILRRADAA
ncbi:MAG: response regulator transcription factor [Deltaproteobacteria bacterium]|nr:response regulator transcription factor [Deltaproteobacteria bacterium]